MCLSPSPPEEATDIVVERGSSRIGRTEVKERADGAVCQCRTIDALHVGLGPGAFDSEAIAVGKAAAGSPALGGDDDGAARRVDSVQRGGLRPFQHGKTFDVLGVEIGSAVCEVDYSVAQRGTRAGV